MRLQNCAVTVCTVAFFDKPDFFNAARITACALPVLYGSPANCPSKHIYWVGIISVIIH
jgi:hypothetical protein